MVSVFLLALSLAMDAFAASVCCGVQIASLRLRDSMVIGLWFGGFQTGMTLIGGSFGRQLSIHLWQVGALLAFGLLLFLGGRMIWDCLSPARAEGCRRYDLRPGPMAALALATSLDALAAGVSLAYLGTGLMLSAGIIGLVAFALSTIGGLLGRQASAGLSRWANLAGGAVLIWLGVKILLG